MTKRLAALAAVLCFVLVACSQDAKETDVKARTITHGGRTYTCIVSDGYESGGLWCERVSSDG